MSESLRVTPASPGDVPLVRQLIGELADYERLSHEVVSTDSDIADALFGPNPAAEALIGYVDDVPVGFALFFTTFSTFRGRRGLYLEDLFVRPSARGKGLGQALLARLAAIAVERGYARVAWAVLNWNEPAIGFYKRLGALPEDTWTVYALAEEPLEHLATERLSES